jgi:CheY-like chemotaxis protein
MSKTIIWIEDDYDIIEPVIYPLRKAGYTIINIPTTKEAIEKLEELKKADLLLLDTSLPSGDGGRDYGDYPGLKLLQDLRKISDFKTPVVIFTVIRNEELRKQLEELKIEGIVYKPVRPSELKEVIDKILM